MKIIPYIYELASRSELSKTTFDAKRVANIIKEILYLKFEYLWTIQNIQNGCNFHQKSE